MKLVALLLFIPFYFSAQTDYHKELFKHRAEKDIEFKDSLKSPLKKQEIADFENLNYFAPDTNFKVTAKFTKNIGPAFEMTTSSGMLKKFRKFGTLSFQIEGKSLELNVYQNLKLMTNPLYRDYAFIPFTDLTNGEETYGGGRYIEAKLPNSDSFVLDFNYCFNPYCHYTTGYNCPIPPIENFLDIRIEAGEKVYNKH